MRQAGLLDEPAAAPAVGTAATSAVPNADTHQSQFGMGLSPEEAYAACGPAAAIGFARQMGRMPSAAEAMTLARQGNWDSGNGMHGVLAEQALLK